MRPLSAGLLPATEAEKNGLIKNEDLGMIRGRSRKPQLQMAKEFGIENPPNAGGGCLLTDPAFGLRAKDLFSHTETPTTNDIDLLKLGRHFRLNENVKLIVGRNKDENEIIKSLALADDVIIEVKNYMGPTSMLRGKVTQQNIEFASAITLRYSDAPKTGDCAVRILKDKKLTELTAKSTADESYLNYRI